MMYTAKDPPSRIIWGVIAVVGFGCIILGSAFMLTPTDDFGLSNYLLLRAGGVALLVCGTILSIADNTQAARR